MTRLDPNLMRQLLETFRIQLGERLQAITDGLLALERTADADEHGRLLEAMFRDAHNVKGAARGVGLENSAELAHALESLFATLKRVRERPAEHLVNLCLAAIDALPPLVEAEATGQPGDGQAHALMQRLRAALATPASETGASGAPTPTSNPAPPAALTPPPAPIAGGDSIRLPVQRLDRIADLAEELQTAKIRLDDHYQASRRLQEISSQLLPLLERLGGDGGPTARRAAPDAEQMAECLDLAAELDELAGSLRIAIRATVSHLRPLASALRDDARGLRMAPASTVLAPMSRGLRDIGQRLGKQVELTTSGERIEMDRAILDALRDPLTHLLRNAIDHGIEAPAVRRARGKPDSGRIGIHLSHEGGMVRIAIEDDGAGIDPQALRAEAVRRGIVGAGELAAMSQTELLDLIFRPGFSTRGQVSEISGRGVGLDVVRVNLQTLNGRVTVDSTPGEGTRFLLSVPLTLAGDHGLFVQAAGQVFALPSQFVSRILELGPDDVFELEASQVVHLDGEPVPLRDLATLLALREPAPETGDRVAVVAINRGWLRAALRVDQVIGEREMVVKPLAPPLAGHRFVAGGTPGRDGNTVLVLEAADLLDAALGDEGAGPVLARREPDSDRPAPRILVVDDSITTRTLEESILVGAGYRVRTATDGEAAWEILRNERFDLVLTDVEMPGMDGFELTRRIKQEARLADLPVVIVTSLGSEADRRRGMEVNADAYIVKSSFESRELLEVVGQLV